MGGGLSDYSISSWPWLVKSQVLGTKLGLAKVKKSFWWVGGGLSDYSISSWPWLDKSQVLGTKARVKARAKELDNLQSCKTISQPPYPLSKMWKIPFHTSKSPLFQILFHLVYFYANNLTIILIINNIDNNL